MDKQIMVYPYNGISLDYEKDWSTDPWYYMDEHWKLSERSQAQKIILYISPLVWNVQNRQIYIDRK